MSLVIAGYDYEMFYDTKMDDGIFAIADSAITSHKGGRTILNGFRKIYELEAKIWKPDFSPDGYFRNYSNIHIVHPFLIGFAGSTLTAQHILNSITGHLEKLRISYDDRKMQAPIEYKIVLPCEENLLITSPIPTSYDETTFLDSDYENLVTGELIANFIEHSINHALKSASSYKLSMEEFQTMYTDLFCGIWCPQKKEHEIYLYRMKSKRNEEGVLFAYTEKQYLNQNEIAVLGMRKDFEKDAQLIYEIALKERRKPSEIAYNFVNACIDKVQSKGSKEIDRPVSFRKLNKYRIKKIK